MENFINKSEEDCLETLEMSDRFVRQYFDLLDRFADLPACDDLVMSQVKKKFPAEFVDELLESFNDEDAENSPLHDANQMSGENGDFEQPSEEEMNDPQMKELRESYAAAELCVRKLKMTFSGVCRHWATVSVMILPDAQSSAGLDLLISLSRMLGTVSGCCDSLVEHNFNMAVVLARRSLTHFRRSLQTMKDLSGIWKQGKMLLSDRVTELKKCRETLDSLVEQCEKIREIESGMDFE